MRTIISTGSRQHVLTGGLTLGLACFSATPIQAQDPPYTYQAVLEANGAPAMGLYSARFRLWDASSNGMPISPADVVAGPTPPDPFGRLNLVPRGDSWSFWRDLLCRVAQPWPPVPFGDWPTAWDPIYLEVGVKGPGEPSFTTLSPRQELTPAPLAINAVLAGRADSLKLPFSASVSTALPAVEITQTGDGPAALFKVQPQPEPPLPKPAVEAISAISSPAILATNIGSGPAVYASSASGNAVHGISTMGSAGYFEGNVHLTGNLTRTYTTGTSNRATPIAYASIDGPTGMVTAGTPNVSSGWDGANERYVLTIAGEAYSSTGFVTTVTPIAGATPEALFAVTSGGSGQLRVRIMSPPSGTTGLQRPFQFVTYKP